MLKIAHSVSTVCSAACAKLTSTIPSAQSFPVKKVTSSHSKNQTVILTEEDISEQELKNAIDPTGYVITSCTREPYEKRASFLATAAGGSAGLRLYACVTVSSSPSLTQLTIPLPVMRTSAPVF